MAEPCTIPMPEGDYPATYVRGPLWWNITIPGGIACPGKAEDAHNTGMDGTWGADVAASSAATIEAACRQVATSIILEREQVGGFELPFPMTVGQAEKLTTGYQKR